MKDIKPRKPMMFYTREALDMEIKDGNRSFENIRRNGRINIAKAYMQDLRFWDLDVINVSGRQSKFLMNILDASSPDISIDPESALKKFIDLIKLEIAEEILTQNYEHLEDLMIDQVIIHNDNMMRILDEQESQS